MGSTIPGKEPPRLGKNNSIVRNSTIDMMVQITVMALSLVVGIFLARLLGDEGRGEYVLATAFAGQLLLGFTNFGVETAASVMVAKDRSTLAPLHTLLVLGCMVMGVLLITLWYFAVGFLTTWVVPGLPGWALLALFAALPFWIYQFGCFGMLIGLGRVRDRALFELFFNVLQNVVIAGVLVFAALGTIANAVTILIVCYYGIIVVGCPWIYTLVRREGNIWRMPDGGTCRNFGRYGFAVYVGNLGTNLGQRIDQYFVQQVGGGTAAFGVYTLATGLAARTRVLPQALARSAYARISSADAPEAARLTAACFRQMLILGLLIAIAGSLASPLIPIVYSAVFAPAVVPFIIFLFGRLAANCSWMLSIYFTGFLGRPTIPMLINWSVLPLQAVGAYFALTLGGLVAVAIVTSLGYFLVFLIFLVMFLRWQKDAGWRDLFLPRSEDFAPWRRQFGRLYKRTG